MGLLRRMSLWALNPLYEWFGRPFAAACPVTSRDDSKGRKTMKTTLGNVFKFCREMALSVTSRTLALVVQLRATTVRIEDLLELRSIDVYSVQIREAMMD